MRRFAPLIAFVAACNAGGVDDVHLATYLEVHSPVTAGATVHALVRNPFTTAIGVGDLGCGIEIDRRDLGTWVKVTDGDRSCTLASGFVVASGDTLAFQFVAPTTPGFYRISSQAGPVTGPGQQDLVAVGLFSEMFAVEAARAP